MANKKAGIPTAILLSIQDYEELEDLVETALEQRDPECQKSLKRSRKDIEAGRYVPREAMWQDLIKKEAKAKRRAPRRSR